MLPTKLPGRSVGRHLLKVRLGCCCWWAEIESVKVHKCRLAIPGREKRDKRKDLTRRCCSDPGRPACDMMLHVNIHQVCLSQRLAKHSDHV